MNNEGTTTKENIVDFFNKFQTANEKFDLELIGSCYADEFLFGQPQGVKVVKKEDFLRVLPKRKEFFKNTGQQSSSLISLQEKILDENYVEVKTEWKILYKKDEKVIENFISATYILCKKDEVFQIVVQIDHQDLMKRVQELGLLPFS